MMLKIKLYFNLKSNNFENLGIFSLFLSLEIVTIIIILCVFRFKVDKLGKPTIKSKDFKYTIPQA